MVSCPKTVLSYRFYSLHRRKTYHPLSESKSARPPAAVIPKSQFVFPAAKVDFRGLRVAEVSTDPRASQMMSRAVRHGTFHDTGPVLTDRQLSSETFSYFIYFIRYDMAICHLSPILADRRFSTFLPQR